MGLFPSYLHTSRSREREADTAYYSISQYTGHGSITLKEISRFSAPHISICVSKVPILKKNSRSNANMQPSIMGVYISLHMMVNRCTVNSKHNTQKRMKPSKHLLYKGGMLRTSPCFIIRSPLLLIRWNLNPSELKSPSESSSLHRTPSEVGVHKSLTSYGIYNRQYDC